IVPIAGVLLAYSFLMIPAAIAGMFSTGWLRAVVLGWAVGLVACMVGLIASYNWNLPYSPSLVLSLGLFFLVALVVRSLRRQVA
ncbi:MAG: metal ABC transporter permease, partial [Candidatus Krumholzibacteria bacterium]|nr:metal ABC transporter permease [Candidatus Krumholzibacteria bacterium]